MHLCLQVQHLLLSNPHNAEYTEIYDNLSEVGGWTSAQNFLYIALWKEQSIGVEVDHFKRSAPTSLPAEGGAVPAGDQRHRGVAP